MSLRYEVSFLMNSYTAYLPTFAIVVSSFKVILSNSYAFTIINRVIKFLTIFYFCFYSIIPNYLTKYFRQYMVP